jgi:hypothetical protein
MGAVHVYESLTNGVPSGTSYLTSADGISPGSDAWSGMLIWTT